MSLTNEANSNVLFIGIGNFDNKKNFNKMIERKSWGSPIDQLIFEPYNEQ